MRRLGLATVGDRARFIYYRGCESDVYSSTYWMVFTVALSGHGPAYPDHALHPLRAHLALKEGLMLLVAGEWLILSG